MRRLIEISLVLLLVATGTAVPAAADVPAVKLLSDRQAMYPHAIRLARSGHILATVTHDGHGEIYGAGAAGRNFKRIGTVIDPEANRGMCCAHLFELPQQVGAMRPGTLLWAGSIGRGVGQMSLRIWRSDDHGVSWSYLSTCASSPNQGGVWEPELSVDASGRLVCHFADESFWHSHRHNQALVRTVSTDGITWSDKVFTIAVQPPGYRPGMPHVRRLPSGKYLMTYEICGQRNQFFCEAYFRISPDGWNWGDHAEYGTRLPSRDGRYFAHTPTIALAPNSTPNGRVILTGQMLMNPNGKVDAGNGATLFINENGGRGEWYEVPAPVPVPGARDHNCPNYHPALVASQDGSEVLELATDFNADGVCQTRYATGQLPPFPS